ncbi:MAG TPA: methyltransferase domain-containing protein [Nitrospira sp.]|jgi:ubiquinone/menaquinone biosynthesis C-methylase UbiE|nr:methyltransferase domain-containing protein [Nitrospira sp.]
MTSQRAHQIIEGQRQDWNRVAGAWEKWDRLFEEQIGYLNHRLVGDARIRSGYAVLDLGSGTGYPALLAAQAVGSSGSVIGIDLAADMLAAAERKARRLGLTNIAFKVGDASMLPFDAAAFDAVISRFCLMFLPDVPTAVAEIARVLKPGRWFAAAVWSSAERNPAIGLSIAALKQVIDVPRPDPSAPGIFRLANAGELAGMMEEAGLENVSDHEFLAERTYESVEQYYTSLTEIAAPIQNLMAPLLDGQRQEVKRLILESASRYRRANWISFPIAVRVVVGRKPG